MNTYLKWIVLLVFLAGGPSFGTLRDYFYDNAMMKYRTLNGVKVLLSDRFSFTLWRADYYRDWPLHLSGSADYWGFDLYPALGVNLGKWGPVHASSEFAVYFLSRGGSGEKRPRAFLNLNLPLGPLVLGFLNRIEYRIYETPQKKQKRWRWRPRLRLGTTWSITPVKISPFIYWEHFYQKKSEMDLEQGISTKYREVEIGISSKLSDKVSLGLGHMFQYNPDETNVRGNYSAHRLSVYFFYTVGMPAK